MEYSGYSGLNNFASAICIFSLGHGDICFETFKEESKISFLVIPKIFGILEVSSWRFTLILYVVIEHFLNQI